METKREIGIRKEVLLEAYAGVLVRFLDYFERKHIIPSEASGDGNAFLYLQAVDICRSIVDMTSLEKIIEAEGQFKLFRRVANRLNGYPVDAPV